jgi:hypothetical protein
MDRAFDISDTAIPPVTRTALIPLIPDGVFFIESIEQRKTLLFFVEVDMSTETVSSAKGNTNDFSCKIRNYRSYFETKGYKRYKNWRRTEFKGFRVLVVTNTQSRMESLCRLVEGSPPSDFIWLTHESLLLEQGISDKIWVRGGRQGSPLSSILGPSLAFPCPILPIRP